MTLLITIDPGETSGWALFRTPALANLLMCGTSRDLTLPVEVVATLLRCKAFHALVEKPHTFPNSPADPDDIITLAVTAGRWVQHLTHLGGDVEMVWPQTWKGSTPKRIHNERVLATLSAGEKALLPKKPRARKYPYDHNMLDAVGLGLWKLERTRR